MKRPVWLLSMDTDQFHAPPTTTACLSAYFQKYGRSAANTDIELVHFQGDQEIQTWLQQWQESGLPRATEALSQGLQPVIGLSFYTWNAAEFLDLLRQLKALLPQLQVIAGGPHVQQAEDYLGQDPIDVVVLGEGEITFTQFLDCESERDWEQVEGLAYLQHGELLRTPKRDRCKDLDQFPSPLSVLKLRGDDGQPLYRSISYETSRGCPFRCAFCEWGTGAIGSKMYQWSMARIEDDWNIIVDAGIVDIWLADSNFGALKQDLAKARLLVDLKERTGLPQSFATSWSKSHSRQVQEIALLLHRHDLLPHYQLALQTLTPEALRLSNRQNMSSNEYEPIAKYMSEQGVPIAAELIWGLPGDNLPDFERNLDRLLAVFPNINIFGYTLLPGTEFYRRREEYKIQAIPVAGYDKAKGEYVVGCHTFDTEQGMEGYFLISAHILLIHGHIMPLTTRFLALRGDTGVSALLRTVLRALIAEFGPALAQFDPDDRMAIYEQRNSLYLEALASHDRLYRVLGAAVTRWLEDNSFDRRTIARIGEMLRIDQALCPRTGGEQRLNVEFTSDAAEIFRALAAMELPAAHSFDQRRRTLAVQHPGGVGEILLDADGGSWLCGKFVEEAVAVVVEVA